MDNPQYEVESARKMDSRKLTAPKARDECLESVPTPQRRRASLPLNPKERHGAAPPDEYLRPLGSSGMIHIEVVD